MVSYRNFCDEFHKIKKERKVVYDNGRIRCELCGASAEMNDAGTIYLTCKCDQSFREEKEERVEPVSIWKDVSELPEDEKLSVIVELESGEKCFALFKKGWGFCEMTESRINDRQGFQPKEIKYCTLTDFINSIEQMQKDIEELKGKL